MNIRCFSVSFDDGDKTLITNVYPILEKYNVKATVFINTHFIGMNKHLTKNDIKFLHSNGWEIGAHSHYHFNLAKMTFQELYNDLEYNKKFLEDLIGEELIGFAYPFGEVHSFDIKSLIIVNKLFKYARINGDFYHKNFYLPINFFPISNLFIIGSNFFVSSNNEYKLVINKLLTEGGWSVFFSHRVDHITIPNITEFESMIKSFYNSKIDIIRMKDFINKYHNNLIYKTLSNDSFLEEWAKNTWNENLIRKLHRKLYYYFYKRFKQ